MCVCVACLILASLSPQFHASRPEEAKVQVAEVYKHEASLLESDSRQNQALAMTTDEKGTVTMYKADRETGEQREKQVRNDDAEQLEADAPSGECCAGRYYVPGFLWKGQTKAAEFVWVQPGECAKIIASYDAIGGGAHGYQISGGMWQSSKGGHQIKNVYLKNVVRKEARCK